MMNILRVAFSSGLLLLLMSIAAMAQSVQTDYDHSFYLARLKTYEFYPQERQPGDALAASPLNDRRIHDALDNQLRSHGLFSSLGAPPDFLIAYFVTIHRGIDIRDNRFGLLQRMGSININQITEGTLVVIIIDRITQQEVWRGFRSGTINPKHLDKDVNHGIAKLIDQFRKDQKAKK